MAQQQVMGYGQVEQSSFHHKAFDSKNLEKVALGIYESLQDINNDTTFVNITLNNMLDLLLKYYDVVEAQNKNPEMLVLGFLVRNREGKIDKLKDYKQFGEATDIIRYATFWQTLK